MVPIKFQFVRFGLYAQPPRARLGTLMPPFSRIFVLLFCVAATFAATPPPTVRLLEPARAASETDRPTILLQGVADGGAGAVNVRWSNQYGARGAGKLEDAGFAGGHSVRWTVEAVPLRVGANLITVSIVDAENRSAAVQLAIFRKSAAGVRGESQGVHSGLWRDRTVFYEIRKGMAVVEGDIVLGFAESMTPSATATAGSKAGLADRRLGPHPAGNALDYTAQLWPSVGGVYQVPYILQNGSSDLVTAAVDAFNLSFAGLIQFVARTSEVNYVNIDIDPNFFPGEGQSWVGMVGGEQTLTCSPECTVGTMLHEMGHTVGLLHEHQRPDRNQFVTFTQANADLPNVAGNFTLYPFDDQTLGLYDYASLMHYGPFDFSKAGLPVIESIPPGIPLGNSSGYSVGDLDQVRRLYGATAAAVTVTTNPAGLQFIADGVTYTAPQPFSWTAGSTHTLDLPPDPQQSNPADGSVYAYGRWSDSNARTHKITVFGGIGTLTSPANRPAVTVYEANFIHLQPFAGSVYPAGAGTLTPNPAPVPEYGGAFYTDRQLVSLTATANAGQNFYDWFNLPYPASDNPKPLYIQAPYTTAQARFTSMPVTIVGESITGPTTWNPLLEASVDNAPTFLPAGFTQFYQPSWTPGSTHSLDVASTQSPVTTNVFYTWDNWSDGGSQSHNIQQVSSGTQTIAASFTPSYSAYSLVNPYCGGSVTFTPIGNPLGSWVSFSDGTPVTTTATANATYPGMVFAGWSGSLTGGVNPDSTTIHDQFVPTANFNATSTAIAISSFRPANAIANANAMDLTINGAGFTSSTYTYWNGNLGGDSYRPNTFVNSTELTMHLNAGDVAAAGGQDVYVGNYVANPQNPNDSCGAAYEATFDVKAAAGASALLHIVKSHTGNFKRGQTGAQYTLAVTNAVNSQPTSGKVVVTEVPPKSLTVTSMSGSGWACAGTSCNRSDVLMPARAYPSITVTVNVASNAPASVTNAAAVSGGASPVATAQNKTKILP